MIDAIIIVLGFGIAAVLSGGGAAAAATLVRGRAESRF